MRSLLFGGLAVFLALLALPIVRDLRRIRGSRRADLRVGGEMVQDPVCRVYLPKETALSQTTQGEIRYFCSEACARRFEQVVSRAVGRSA